MAASGGGSAAAAAAAVVVGDHDHVHACETICSSFEVPATVELFNQAIETNNIKLVLYLWPRIGSYCKKPLHRMCYHGVHNMIRQFLQLDGTLQLLAQAETCHVFGESFGEYQEYLPMHLAAFCGFHCIVELLLEKCADLAQSGGPRIDINTPTSYGATMLFLACKGGDTAIEMIEFLLARGANQAICNKDHIYPLRLAACNSFVKVFHALLYSKGAKEAFENSRIYVQNVMESFKRNLETQDHLIMLQNLCVELSDSVVEYYSHDLEQIKYDLINHRMKIKSGYEPLIYTIDDLL